MVSRSFKNKIVVVGSVGLGRVGTSATMGLLKKLGFNLGGFKSNLGRASPTNKKGHFEVRGYKDFLHEAMPAHYPSLVNIPTLKRLVCISDTHRARFMQLIKDEFRNKFPIAIKDARLLILPFIINYFSKYQIKVIVLSRNFEDQLNSIMVKNAKLKGEKARKLMRKHMLNWRAFVSRMRKHYKMFEYLDVAFEDLMNKPLEISSVIADFVETRRPTKQKIMSWIDPKLAHIKFGAT
jgi:hypothetical protein